jgi:hypothetical protein
MRHSPAMAIAATETTPDVVMASSGHARRAWCPTTSATSDNVPDVASRITATFRSDTPGIPFALRRLEEVHERSPGRSVT